MSTFPSFFTGLYISNNPESFEMYKPVKKDGKVLITTSLSYTDRRTRCGILQAVCVFMRTQVYSQKCIHACVSYMCYVCARAYLFTCVCLDAP